MNTTSDPISGLVDEIKGTTNFLSHILSARLNFWFALIILGAILAITIFSR